MEIFWTVVTGVTVFVLGKLIEQFVIKPILALREAFGEISYFVLSHQATLTNCNASEDVANSLKRMSAINVAKYQAIPFSSFWAWCRFIPKHSDVLKASGLLNLMSNDVRYGLDTNYFSNIDVPGRVYTSLVELGDHLKINTTYRL
jgi:hypothetical protein